jgi:secondary thiamine-phosphate synthase enzyme
MLEFNINTKSRVELIDITDEVNRALDELKSDSGLCNIFIPHTSAAVIVSENWDPDVTTDMLCAVATDCAARCGL